MDVEAAETISAITKQWPDLLLGAGVTELTTAHLHGEKRSFTTAVAEKIHGSILSDGSYAHGIVYSSKHDVLWRCWAIWLRAVDDGKTLWSEPTHADDGHAIEEPHQNAALQRVADLFGFRCH
ncbi:RES domain protein [Mycobacterium kansasii 732]|nr:RES domain protein [Mycobacterium kansasii 732]